jgi:phage gpG-like protein
LRKVGNQTRFAKKTHKKAREMTVRVGAHTIHIPARPYLGVSEADKDELRHTVEDYFMKLLRF